MGAGGVCRMARQYVKPLGGSSHRYDTLGGQDFGHKKE